MKCLTLWQPYASLIAVGAKKYETRGFRPPAALIGERIAIHAAARPVRRATERPAHRGWLGTDWSEFGPEVDFLCWMNFGRQWIDDLPRGAVVATAIIDSVHRAEDIRDTLSADELAVGDWYGTPDKPNRFGWLLRDVIELPAPVPWKGKQGWGNWEPEGDRP